MAEPVDFPTKAAEGTGAAVVEVIDVKTGHNAKYGPQGSDGLFIELQFTSGKSRSAFFKELPATRTNVLIKELKNLGIDLDDIGWAGLIGMKFRWVQEERVFNFFIAEKNKREDVPVKCEYPVELLDGEQAIGDSTTEDAPAAEEASSNGADAPSDETMEPDTTREQYLDMVLLVADDEDLAGLRKLGKSDDDLKTFSTALRAELARGGITDELIEAGRLTKDDDGKFHVAEA